jgi:hypothetical protein
LAIKPIDELTFTATIFHGYITRDGKEMKLVLDNNNPKRVVVIAYEDWEKFILEGKQIISFEVIKITKQE